MPLPRLRRRGFWLLTTAVWVAFFLLRPTLEPGALGLAAPALALLALGALAVARLHDRSRSGWWLAAVLIPVAGAL